MKKKEPVATQTSRKHILPAELTDRYELGPRLGSGGYGFVVSAVDRLTGQPCAVKFIYKRKIPSSSSQLPIEISLLQHTEHTNIILMESYFQDEVFFYLVMEAPHSTQDLFSSLEEHDYFSERLARHIFIQVVEAVLYLKQIGFYHRDIKDENILIDRSFNVRC
jgi:serine/threonine protein kinase